METELRDVEYYATTTDMWSSRTTRTYLSHFINDNFELKSSCLQTAYFPTDHIGENIALGLRECLSNWGLKEEDQTCITADDAANLIKAMKLINGPDFNVLDTGCILQLVSVRVCVCVIL